MDAPSTTLPAPSTGLDERLSADADIIAGFDDLLCPLHLGIFVDPVITPAGFTYCRHCITTYIGKVGSDPFDAEKKPVDVTTQLYPNKLAQRKLESISPEKMDALLRFSLIVEESAKAEPEMVKQVHDSQLDRLTGLFQKHWTSFKVGGERVKDTLAKGTDLIKEKAKNLPPVVLAGAHKVKDGLIFTGEKVKEGSQAVYQKVADLHLLDRIIAATNEMKSKIKLAIEKLSESLKSAFESKESKQMREAKRASLLSYLAELESRNELNESRRIELLNDLRLIDPKRAKEIEAMPRELKPIAPSTPPKIAKPVAPQEKPEA